MSLRPTRHALVLAAFAVLTAAWLAPVWQSANHVIPGAGAGDNLSFVWNLWWTRRALAAGASPLSCPVLFAPFGVSLVLHTHTLLAAFVVAPFATEHSLIAATNLTVATHLFLNFAVAYSLAFRVSSSVEASALAGIVFGCSPYVGAHLLGHYNLIAAWVLPLVVWFAIDAVEGTQRMTGGLLGLTLGAAAYLDYYYAVYAIALVGLFVASRTLIVSLERRELSTRQRLVLMTLGPVVAAAAGAAVLIAITGGTTAHIGSISVSMLSAGNPVAATGLLVLLAALVVWVPRIRAHIDWPELDRVVRRLVPALLIAAIAIAPLALAALHLWLQGDYASQRYLWRSAPAGIDLGTLVLGNPRGLLWGGLPLRAFANLGIDDVEQAVWLAPGALLLCWSALRARRRFPGVTRWAAVAALFLLWALGPYVVAFGRHFPVLLPAALVRYVPIIANARIPARAIVVVYLAISMLTAYGFVALRLRGRAGLAFLLAGLAIADLVPAPTAVYRVDRPALYDLLRTSREQGSVCELPLGIRDGFGETGRFDNRALWYQTIHERALVGGFIARLPRRMLPAYEAAPVLGSFLRLSAGLPLARETVLPSDQTVDALVSQGVRFIVLNRLTSPPDLMAYVNQLSLRQIATDGERILLIVEHRAN